MMNQLIRLITLFSLLAIVEAASVVVTIKPIHSLVSFLLQGVPNVDLTLLCQGVASPHGEQLKPSQIHHLIKADLVIWVGASYETGMAEPIRKIDRPILALDQIPSLHLKPRRFQDEGCSCSHHSASSIDGHFWLSPDRMIECLGVIKEHLFRLFPGAENQPLIQQNTVLLQQKLMALSQSLQTLLAPVRSKPYGVYHDFLQYFDETFGTSCQFWVTAHPDAPLTSSGFRSFETLSNRPVCLFTEPQFPDHILKKIADKLAIPLYPIDYLGQSVPPGPEAYGQMIQSIAEQIKTGLETGKSFLK